MNRDERKEFVARHRTAIFGYGRRQDGPAMTIVYYVVDGDDLLVSTTIGRRKETNLRRDPRITVMINPATAPYTYAEVRGTATLTTEGGQELINALSRKYTGKDYPWNQPGEERVVVKIRPTHATTQG